MPKQNIAYKYLQQGFPPELLQIGSIQHIF